MSSGVSRKTTKRIPPEERKIPESRLPLPTSSLVRTSRYSRHFDKGHFKWAFNNKQVNSNVTSNSAENKNRSHEKRIETISSPKKFSLCMTGIESSDEDSDYPRREAADPRFRMSSESFVAKNSSRESKSNKAERIESIDFCARQPTPENKQTTGPRKSSLPVRCASTVVASTKVKSATTSKTLNTEEVVKSVSRNNNRSGDIFEFEEEGLLCKQYQERKSSQTFVDNPVSVLIQGPSIEDRYINKRRRRKKKADNVATSKNGQKSNDNQSCNSSMSGGSKRSSVISDSNDSNVDNSSLGILSPTEMQSNGSLSASVTSCGSNFQTSWINSVKRMAVDSSSKVKISPHDLSVEDIEGEDTLAEETSSSTSNTLSSNPSTSSSSSLPRKTSLSNVGGGARPRDLSTKKSMTSMVPRPTSERTTRCGGSSEEDYPSSPTKFHRFHLDSETVREIESLDYSDHRVPTFDTVNMSTKIPIYESSNSARSPTYDYANSKIPSRLPKLASKAKSETYPDVSDIFLARTEELLKSSRSKSGKKRRHTTNEEPKFDYPNSDSSNPTSIDLSYKRQNPHLPLKRSESPPPVALSYEHYQCPRSFILNEVDAGIGNSMPSSIISNASMMATSQDIGMSQYEMESSGVFSDADHHSARKSSLFFDPKIVAEQRSGLEPELVTVPSAILPELTEENDGNDVKFDLDENDENARPEIENVQDCEGVVVHVEDDLTPKVEDVQQHASSKALRKESSSLTREETSRPGSRHLKPVSDPVPIQRPRSQDSKGLATKRSELLQEKPIVPNTNVGSKLKEILSRQSVSAEPRKPKLPGKWDAIMNSIAEGRQKKSDVDLADRVREAKSKVFADFRPPVIRSRMTTPAFSRSNSTVSSTSAVAGNGQQRQPPKAMPSRSNSTISSSGAGASRSSSHLSAESMKAKQPGSRSSSISSTVSSCKGSEVTLKGPKNSAKVEASSRQKSGLVCGPRSNSANKDVSRQPISAPVATTSKTTTRKSSAPATTTTAGTTATSRKISVTNKAISSNAKMGAPTSASTNGRINSSNNSITSSANSTTSSGAAASKNYNQPDLVKVSSPAPQHQELQRENLQLRQRLGHSAKGFTAMAVALNHVTKELGVSDTQKLRQEISKLRQHIQDQNEQIAKLNESYNEELSKYKNSLSEATDFKLKLEEIQEQHRVFVEKLVSDQIMVVNDYQAEVERLRETHRLDRLRLGVEQEELIRQLEARHLAQLDETESRWKAKLAQKFEYKSDELTRQESDFERREEHWAEAKRALEDRIHSLEAELKEREEESLTKHKGDASLRITTNKLANITAEVDSLKAVLEIKSEELRGLRADKIRLEEKLVDFDQMRASLQKATALCEDLKAQIDTKNNLERKLSYENRRLQETMEREFHERKKLSQENEELHYKIRQSFCLDGSQLSTSLIDYSSSTNPMFTSLQQQNILSASYTAESGCPQSLPYFSGRNVSRLNNAHRPVSAPPGKFDFLTKLSCTSTPKHNTDLEPDSPRVLEIFEKNESVSWKLEYNEAEAEMCGSPNLKRKLSPHSPLTIRKSRNGKPHPGGDVMSRSMMDSSRSSPCPSNDVMMARSCIGSLSRSNSTSSSRSKKVVPSFETLRENANDDETETKSNQTKEFMQAHGSLADQIGPKMRNSSERSTNSSNLSSISDEEDIGDISSSSEIEVNEPMTDVTTPQIEEMQFLFPGGGNHQHTSEASSPDAEVTLRDELSNNTMTSSKKMSKQRLRSDGVMSKSVQGNVASVVSVMSNSLPSYDLHRLFKGPEILQNSGGESLMARFEEEDPFVMSGMTDSTSTESDDPEFRVSPQQQQQQLPSQQLIEDICVVKHQPNTPNMAESLSGVSWSEDFDQLP